MGRDIERIERAPAGNIVGIGGLGRCTSRATILCAALNRCVIVGNHLLNTGTISSLASVVPFSAMSYQAAPIVRVSVQPERPADMQALARGLHLLNQADPNVEVLLMEV